jgi:antitoxin ParD1/3/4
VSRRRLAIFANLCQRCYDAAMSNTTMNISLPEALREYVDERVAEGTFANASDYVRALIREDRLKRAQASLEAKLLEGLESGPAVVADDAYWEALERDVRELVAKRKRSR